MDCMGLHGRLEGLFRFWRKGPFGIEMLLPLLGLAGWGLGWGLDR